MTDFIRNPQQTGMRKLSALRMTLGAIVVLTVGYMFACAHAKQAPGDAVMLTVFGGLTGILASFNYANSAEHKSKHAGSSAEKV